MNLLKLIQTSAPAAPIALKCVWEIVMGILIKKRISKPWIPVWNAEPAGMCVMPRPYNFHGQREGPDLKQSMDDPLIVKVLYSSKIIFTFWLFSIINTALFDDHKLLGFRGIIILNYTLFDTPVIKTLMRWMSVLILKMAGWKLEGNVPDVPKFVVIAAPHTSNWDLPFTLFVALALKVNLYWMGKEEIFKAPFGGFFKWLGGIPIDRSKSNNIVEESIEQFRKNERLVLTVPPSGTRKKVLYWKTGFYHIANGAGVPIVLGFLDYKRKAGGVLSVFYPTGDIDADMEKIIEYYRDVSGKFPEKSMVYKPKSTESEV